MKWKGSLAFMKVRSQNIIFLLKLMDEKIVSKKEKGLCSLVKAGLSRQKCSKKMVGLKISLLLGFPSSQSGFSQGKVFFRHLWLCL